MADHRKNFRHRRHSLLRTCARSGFRAVFTLAVLCAAAALPSTAFSQDIGLRRGEASLNAGEFDAAARQLSATVNDADATINQVARALYLRGIAYRRAGYPGQAVSDLGAALWLGLPSEDKARAYVNKGLAFQAAGMASQGSSAMAQARRYSSASTVERLIAQDGGVGPVASSGIADYVPSASGVWDKVPSASGVWDKIVPSFGSSDKTPETASSSAAASAEPQAAPTEGWDASVNDGSSGNAVSRWWGAIAGGGTEPAPAAGSAAQSTSVARSTTATRTAAAPAAPPSAGSWAANTEVSSGESGSGIGGWFSRQTAAATAAITGGGSAAPAASTGAGYTVQLANSSTKSEAEALWAKAKRSNSSLASASPRIERVNIGGLGTFYTVKIGPFASQSEGTRICNSIKRGGTDCSVISPGGP